MKRLILINGPMGIGKTTVGRRLAEKLPNCQLIDGDDAWRIFPFEVNEETQKLVVANLRSMIAHALNSAWVENLVLTWVIPEETIFDLLLDNQPLRDTAVFRFTLLGNEKTLRERIERDVAAGLRTPDVLERSLRYLPKFEAMNTEKIDTAEKDPEEIAARLLEKLDI